MLNKARALFQGCRKAFCGPVCISLNPTSYVTLGLLSTRKKQKSVEDFQHTALSHSELAEYLNS